jgi:hypothetical protein
MPRKKGSSKPKTVSFASSKKSKTKETTGKGVLKPSKGVQGPFMEIKKRDANQLTKIY